VRVFKEVQRFDQWWVQLINIGLLVFLLYCLYKWFIVKESTGNVAATDITGQIITICSLIPVLVLFYMLKMKTIIDEVGIHYQFLPFHFSSKTVRWAEIEKCYVRTYNPIKEYGGWGYRTSLGKKSRAYNVKGNKGIQLEFKTGKHLLIGTQKEDETQQIIQRHYKTSDE
jgi:hypothetical protein